MAENHDERTRGMKAKTIKAVIRKKIDEWLASIDVESVREIAASNVIVTGGAIASMLLGERVNDFDIYLRTRQAALVLAKYYAERFTPKQKNGIPCQIWVDHEQEDQRIRLVVKSAGIASEEGTAKPYQYFEGRPAEEAASYVSGVMQDPGDAVDMADEVETAVLATNDDGKPTYRPVFLSTNAITLSQRIQIILRFYGEPDEIHENYDFVHCTSFWSSWDNTLVLRPNALEALLSKELRYVGSKYPICSIIRLRKFIRRGWTINAGQILKMVMQVSELDLKNPAVLQDQLTGVDVAYFVQVIQALHEKDPDKVNAAYVCEIIDRMF